MFCFTDDHKIKTEKHLLCKLYCSQLIMFMEIHSNPLSKIYFCFKSALFFFLASSSGCEVTVKGTSPERCETRFAPLTR